MLESTDSEDSMLIVMKLFFEVFQSMRSSYLNVTDGRTDNLPWH